MVYADQKNVMHQFVPGDWVVWRNSRPRSTSHVDRVGIVIAVVPPRHNPQDYIPAWARGHGRNYARHRDEKVLVLYNGKGSELAFPPMTKLSKASDEQCRHCYLEMSAFDWKKVDAATAVWRDKCQEEAAKVDCQEVTADAPSDVIPAGQDSLCTDDPSEGAADQETPAKETPAKETPDQGPPAQDISDPESTGPVGPQTPKVDVSKIVKLAAVYAAKNRTQRQDITGAVVVNDLCGQFEVLLETSLGIVAIAIGSAVSERRAAFYSSVPEALAGKSLTYFRVVKDLETLGYLQKMQSLASHPQS